MIMIVISVIPDSDNEGFVLVTEMDKESGGTFTYSTKTTMEKAMKWLRKKER
jgi:hypothetical protein